MKTKHILYAASLLMLALSCVKTEEFVEDGPVEDIEVTGVIVSDDSQTKVSYEETLAGNIKATWVVGDEIRGFQKDVSPFLDVCYTVASVDSDGKATFSYNFGTKPKEGETVHMMYYAGRSISGNLSVDFFGQNGLLNSLDRKVFMCASATVTDGKLDLKFENQTAIIGIEKFTGLKPNTTYSRLTFSAYSPYATAKLVGGKLQLVTDPYHEDIILDGEFVSDANGETTSTIYISVPKDDLLVPHEFRLHAEDDHRVGTLSRRKIEAGKYYHMATKKMQRDSLVKRWSLDNFDIAGRYKYRCIVTNEYILNNKYAGPAFTEDRFNHAKSAVLFNGTNQLRFENGFPTVGEGSFSLNFWFKTPGKASTWYMFYIDGWHIRGRNNVSEFKLVEEGNNEHDLPLTLLKDEWHMMTLVRDVTRKTFSWYIDGSLAGSRTFDVPYNYTSTALNMGTNPGGYGYQGCLDDVRLYDAALSESDIERLCGGPICAANVSDPSSGRTICEAVRLWENGPEWAKFNVGSTANSYAGATDYDQAYVGGYYSYRGRLNLISNARAVADTATELWGENWRTPTSAEQRAMVDNCDFTYCDGETVQYEENCTIKGYKVTGRGAYSNNSIFLPLAGVSDQNQGNGTMYFYNPGQKPGLCGYFWSIDSGGSGAYFLGIMPGGGPSISSHNQPHGCNVRAVVVR